MQGVIWRKGSRSMANGACVEVAKVERPNARPADRPWAVGRVRLQLGAIPGAAPAREGWAREK